MLIEHRNDEMRTALVFVNSFDFQKEEIEDYMEENRIYAEVFEIDGGAVDIAGSASPIKGAGGQSVLSEHRIWSG